MPIYEYKCLSCGLDFSELLEIGASAPPCPKCGCKEAKKKMSKFASISLGNGESYSSPSSCSSCTGGTCSACGQ